MNENIYNPFKFVEIVREGNAILFKVALGGPAFMVNAHWIKDRIAMIKNNAEVPESELDMMLAEEYKALREWEREKARDQWPDEIVA